MFGLTTIVLGLFVAILIHKIFFSNKTEHGGQKNLPPIPKWNLPLIGHLYMFKDDPIDTLLDLGKEFNGIYRFGFGPTTAVMITDPQLVHQVHLYSHTKFSQQSRHS